MNWEMIAAMTAVLVAVCTCFAWVCTKVFKLGELNQKLDRHDAEISDVKTEMKDIRGEIKDIRSELKEHFEILCTIKTMMQIGSNGIDTLTMSSQKNSPRELNELGKKVYADMNGEEFLKKNKDALFEKIDKENPKALLDVEHAALIVCRMMASSDMFIPIRNFVYDYPTVKTAEGKDVEISLEIACNVLHLPLRDMYLAEHKFE